MILFDAKYSIIFCEVLYLDVRKRIFNNTLTNKNFLAKGGEPKNFVKNELANPILSNATNPNRLNALDSTLVEDSAYQKIENEAFRIEYRIDKLEAQLRSINAQIESTKALNDKGKLEGLGLKKTSIEKELKELYSKYQGSNVSSRISFGISSVLQPKKSVLATVKDTVVGFVSQKILPKISKRFNTGQELKVALDKLKNINKTVDELVSSQAPYGEAEEKYDRLSKYLTKANTIQYQVSVELSKKKSNMKNANPFEELTSRQTAEAKEKKMKLQDKKKTTANNNALNLNNNLKG